MIKQQPKQQLNWVEQAATCRYNVQAPTTHSEFNQWADKLVILPLVNTFTRLVDKRLFKSAIRLTIKRRWDVFPFIQDLVRLHSAVNSKFCV